MSRGAGSEQFVERMPKGALLQRRKAGHYPRCRSPLKVFKLAGRTASLLPTVPTPLTAWLTVDANQQASARSGQVPAVTAARQARSQ
jgi:hypothetical protein